MQILPSQKAIFGFNILDSFQGGSSLSKAGDIFADLLKFTSQPPAPAQAASSQEQAPLAVATPQVVSGSPTALDEPAMPGSHADDSLRNVKMTQEDYAELKDTLEQAGVPKEKIEKLGEKIKSPEGVTWGEFMHSMREMTLDKVMKPANLSSDEKAAISSLLTRMGFDPKQADSLTEGLAGGKPGQAFAAISAKLKGLDPGQTITLSKEEMAALAKAVKLSDSASQRLLAKFGANESLELTPDGMRKAILSVKNELSSQVANAKDALQTVKDALHPAMEKARHHLEVARQAVDSQVESSQVKPSSLLKDPQDNAVTSKDAQPEAGKPSSGAQVDPAVAARDGRQQNQRFAGRDASQDGSHNGFQNGKNAQERAVGEFTGKLRVEGDSQTLGDSRFGLGQGLTAASLAAQAKGDASQVLKGYNTQVLSQVESGILRNMGQGMKQLTLELTPDNLGKLNVMLTVKGKDVQAVIRADSPEAEKILAENIQQIKQSLENQGLTVSKMEVRPGISQDSNLGQQWGGADKHNQSQDRREALERLRTSSLLADVAGGGGLAQGMQNRGAEVKISQGGLDIIA